MATANMFDVFNSKITAFNKAVKDNDKGAVISIGSEILSLALTECSKPNVSGMLKENYVKQSKVILTHLTNTAYSVPAVSRSSSETEVGGDPYYTERQWFSDEVPNLGFADIIGVQEVKDAFMVDVVAPLRPEFRDLYVKFRGNQMGSQILLYGPPGTGKTHIVKCLAGALNCKIAVVQTSEVLASIVGIAEKNIRDIFKQASELDRCIIFFDEIDSICSDRNSEDSRNTKSVLTSLLTYMDGFTKTTKDNQLRIIVAATNLPWKLDSALKRGGRFETQIYVPLPDEVARKKFIEQGLAKLPHDAEVKVEMLSDKLSGYSGADIKAILRQIANRPLKRSVIDRLNGRNAEANNERVTVTDCDEVIKDYINSINSEMLLRFKAYDMGISYEELLVMIRKSKQ